MTDKEIAIKVKKIISEVMEISVAKVKDDSSQKTIENWDSLAHLKLVMELEKKLGVTFNTQEVFSMETISEICNQVKKHLT